MVEPGLLFTPQGSRELTGPTPSADWIPVGRLGRGRFLCPWLVQSWRTRPSIRRWGGRRVRHCQRSEYRNLLDIYVIHRRGSSQRERKRNMRRLSGIFFFFFCFCIIIEPTWSRHPHCINVQIQRVISHFTSVASSETNKQITNKDKFLFSFLLFDLFYFTFYFQFFFSIFSFFSFLFSSFDYLIVFFFLFENSFLFVSPPSPSPVSSSMLINLLKSH